MADDKEKPHIVIGYDMKLLLNADIKDIKTATEFWMEQVAEKIGLTADVVVYTDSASILKDFKDGKVDIVSTTALVYFKIANELEIEVAYSGMYANKKPTRKYLIIVRSDVGFTKIKDFARKKLAIQKTDDTAFLFLNTHLLREKVPEAADFFSSIIEKRKSSQAILSVFFRQADVCITNEETFNVMTELNPQVGKQLMVIASSPEIVSLLSFYRKDCSERKKTILRKLNSNLANSVVGQQLLTLFKLTGIYWMTDSDLDSFRLILNEYRQLKGNVQARKPKGDN